MQVTLTLQQLAAITTLAARPGIQRDVVITTRYVNGTPHAEVTVGHGEDFETFDVNIFGEVTGT